MQPGRVIWKQESSLQPSVYLGQWQKPSNDGAECCQKCRASRFNCILGMRTQIWNNIQLIATHAKLRKSHYTAKTQRPNWSLLGNEWKRNIKMHSGWFVLPSLMSLGTVGLILMGRCFQWGTGGGKPNCIHKWNFNFLNTNTKHNSEIMKVFPFKTTAFRILSHL